MNVIVVLKMRRGMEFSSCFGYVLGSNWVRRYLFLCRHFEIISDLWFKSLYCNWWMIIATFSCSQNRHLLDI